MSSSVTFKFPAAAEPLLRDFLVDRGFAIEAAPYAYFNAKSPRCSVTLYKSGKLLIQGKDAAYWSESLSPRAITGEDGGSFSAAMAKLPDAAAACWVGSDESGKGDYFGPLVVCAAAVDREQIPLLEELGVADSKSLSDVQVTKLARGLKAMLTYDVVVLRPERYNDLYGKMGRNLNRLLAWCHARAIESVLEKRPEIAVAVVDQFGPETRLERALMPRAREISVVQRPRAEDDPAVAAASVLARNAFVWELRGLEKDLSVRLPKGAGPPVLAAARAFVRARGAEELGRVAKLHFKTTRDI